MMTLDFSKMENGVPILALLSVYGKEHTAFNITEG